MVFHRCVIAVIGVLAVSTSAAAGPIKLGESGPSLNIDELRASGARMDDKELRALFFRGAGSRNAVASCAECLVAESSLHARERARSDYDAFPFSAVSLFPPRPAKSSSHHTGSSHPTVTAVADVSTVALIPPLSSSEAVAPVAITAPSPVPEPGSVVLMGTGLTGGWLVRRRRNRTQRA